MSRHKKQAPYQIVSEFDFSPTGKHYASGDEDTLTEWTPEQVAHALEAGFVVLADGEKPDSGEVNDG